MARAGSSRSSSRFAFKLLGHLTIPSYVYRPLRVNSELFYWPFKGHFKGHFTGPRHFTPRGGCRVPGVYQDPPPSPIPSPSPSPRPGAGRLGPIRPRPACTVTSPAPAGRARRRRLVTVAGGPGRGGGAVRAVRRGAAGCGGGRGGDGPVPGGGLGPSGRRAAGGRLLQPGRDGLTRTDSDGLGVTRERPYMLFKMIVPAPRPDDSEWLRRRGPFRIGSPRG